MSSTHLSISPSKQASKAQTRNLIISTTSILSTARNCLPMPAVLTGWRRERISSMERKGSFHAKPATEVDSDALVIDHHVHASVVAVAGSRLALTVQYLATHVLDIGNTL